MPATVNGVAFFDTNSNGAQDTGEGFAAGVVATLTAMGGGEPVSVTTGADGTFAFTGPLSGSYSVQFTPPAGYTVGTPAGGTSYVYVGTEDVDIGVGLVGEGSGSGSGSSSGSTSGDTQTTFTLPDGVSGTISYDPPLTADSDHASQALPLVNFMLIFEGQTFTPSNTPFDTAPVADFQYGDLVNVRFALAFPNPVVGYASLSLASDIVTAVIAATNQPVAAPVAPAARATTVLDFNGITIPPMTVRYEWTITATAGGQTFTATIDFDSTSSATGVRDAMKTALKDAGLDVTPEGTTRLAIKGPVGKPLTKLVIRTGNRPEAQVGPKNPERIKEPGGAYPDFFFLLPNQ